VQTVLRLVDLGKVTISDKTLYPTGASLNAIVEVLEEGDYYSDWTEVRSPGGGEYDYALGSLKPFAWVMLLQAGKLVQLSGKRLSLTKAGHKAFNDSPEKTLQSLWKNWLKTTVLDELRRVESVKGQTGKGKRSLTAVAGRRSKIVDALKTCPVGRWIALSDFFRYMIAAGYEFEVSRHPESLSIDSYGSLDDASFLLLEARYILAFLFEYVSVLGLIDVACIHPNDGMFNFQRDVDLDYYYGSCLSRYDGLTYFRITPLGAYFLGLSERYTPAPLTHKQVLRILPNLEVVAVQPLSRADRLMLDSFVQPVSDSVWRLEPGKLLEAIAQGRTVDELREFLTTNSSEALPQPVVQFLNDFHHRASSLQDLGTARLIRCADASLAMLIANDSRTKAYCFLADQPKAITTGQPCYLVVALESETKFRHALKKLGYSLPG
ncbi:MAG: helicase-associated domain-containing protein, partial [Microcystaceae cyanobacterium]